MKAGLTAARLLSLQTARHTSSSVGLTGPAVKLLLQHYQIDEKSVSRSGPKNNILKSDVLRFIEMGKLKPVEAPVAPAAVETAAPAPTVTPAVSVPSPQELLFGKGPATKFTDIPLTNIRSTIAKRLSASKQNIPHSYITVSVRADRLMKLRSELNAQEGAKMSLNDFVIKAVASALRVVPEMNVRYTTSGSVERLRAVDVSVAVATPTGLITPIIFKADQIGVLEISKRLKELAAKAKANKLQLHEFQGGSFTVSNLGMFGITNFTAIINPPQTAILAVGGTQTELNEELQPENRFRVTLCYDSRAIDELHAQQFLIQFAECVADPDLILAEAAHFDLAALL
ncbi:hypothetical protein QR680_007604 [Steinernema hermaphroditum]|uniref:2-oxoacid dehydrogenase acyltransferase catalytic domain-containing protein n=1 Tax=Steinernema hermaphroditum TaxID=289476 RepID=A0AA39M6E1_9BILA|nr:hypothetical protein QR680_007604 [Steinernema hermaphroditum]